MNNTTVAVTEAFWQLGFLIIGAILILTLVALVAVIIRNWVAYNEYYNLDQDGRIDWDVREVFRGLVREGRIGEEVAQEIYEYRRLTSLEWKP